MLCSEDYGNRNLILESLYTYKEKVLRSVFKESAYFCNDQLNSYNDICRFIQQNSYCFMRECLTGHVTASAFVVNSNFTKVLFTYQWLQLGGHCDGDHLIHMSALREAIEESGLLNLKFIDIVKFPEVYKNSDMCAQVPIPFDIDIHEIPERNLEPAHFHYDIRYLFVADESEDIVISEESLDLKWIPINEVTLYTSELSTLRQVDKFKSLLSN